MFTTLFVRNIPWATTPEELEAAFSQHGEVLKARIITDRETGRSRGFGFVDVPDYDLEKVIEAMNGAQICGRIIEVNVAQNNPRSRTRDG